MATEIIFQDTPYGFKTIQLGTLTIYCGKLRFRDVYYEPNQSYINVAYSRHKGNSYCTISFEVIDKELANRLSQELGRLAKRIAQAKLDGKYGWVK